VERTGRDTARIGKGGADESARGRHSSGSSAGDIRLLSG
jgi:hypothetical protein